MSLTDPCLLTCIDVTTAEIHSFISFIPFMMLNLKSVCCHFTAVAYVSVSFLPCNLVASTETNSWRISFGILCLQLQA
jgi:hypothetical protein